MVCPSAQSSLLAPPCLEQLRDPSDCAGQKLKETGQKAMTKEAYRQFSPELQPQEYIEQVVEANAPPEVEGQEDNGQDQLLEVAALLGCLQRPLGSLSSRATVEKEMKVLEGDIRHEEIKTQDVICCKVLLGKKGRLGMRYEKVARASVAVGKEGISEYWRDKEPDRVTLRWVLVRRGQSHPGWRVWKMTTDDIPKYP